MRARCVPILPKDGPKIPLACPGSQTEPRAALTTALAQVEVRFLDSLFDESLRTYLVLCEIIELGLRQEVWLSIYPRRRGTREQDLMDDSSQGLPEPGREELYEWVIRPAQGSGMVPTLGIQVAIDQLAHLCGWRPTEVNSS